MSTINLRTILTLALGSFLFNACSPVAGVDPQATVTITGQILNDDGTAATDVTVAWLKKDLGGLDLDSADNMGKNFSDLTKMTDGVFRLTRTDNDGKFTFELSGQEVNRTIKEDQEPLPAYNYLLILQENIMADSFSDASSEADGSSDFDGNSDDALSDYKQPSDGLSVILSAPHRFTAESGTDWDIGAITLWNDFSAIMDLEGQIAVTWQKIPQTRFEYYLLDAASDPAWHGFTDEEGFMVPSTAIHSSQLDPLNPNIFIQLLAKNNNWSYRTAPTAFDLSAVKISTPSDVLAENSSWQATGALEDNYNELCPASPGTMINDGLLYPACELDKMAPMSGQYLLFDFQNIEEVSTVVVWDAQMAGAETGCLALYGWSDTHGFEYIDRPWNSKNLLAEQCAPGPHAFVYFSFEKPLAVRNLAIAAKAKGDFSGDDEGYYFESFGEVGIWR